jgi:very-short-patch-repair endonuclease
MANRIIPYNRKLKAFAQQLRKNPTPQEALLWEQLRRRQLGGYEFHRQVPIDEFIVDFFCHELQLAIEVDGRIHDHKILEDASRQRRLESLNVRMMRFTNEEVEKDMEAVLRRIREFVG